MQRAKNTKDLILQTAWELFMDKGYENTTVDEIIQRCNISKGGFYHHFSSKDDLLTYVSLLLDKQYVELENNIDDSLNTKDKLLYYTENLFRYIEDNIPFDILALVLSTQVVKSASKPLLDEKRYYFALLTDLITKGQRKGEISKTRTVRELLKLYTMQERSILYDWCLCEGNYPLAIYGVHMFRLFIQGIFS